MGYDEDNAPPPTPVKKGHGCFFWGCITSLIILVVGVLAIGGGAYYVYRYFIGTLKEYSETAPATLPVVNMPEAERKALHARFDAFNEATKKGDPVEPLILTAEELNALIDDNPDFKGKAHVAIEGDQIKADICLPLKVLNIAELNDRYINGSGTLRASLQNGFLDVRADTIETKGKPLPPDFVKAIQGQNLAKSFNDDAKQRESLERIESMVVKDGKIFLTPRNAKKPDDAAKGDVPPAPDAPKGDPVPPPGEAPKAADAPPPGEAPKADPVPPPEAPKGDPAPAPDAPKTPAETP